MRHANEKEVDQISHNPFVDARRSCDRFRFRVESEPIIGSPIDVDADDSGRQQSSSELTSDHHSRPVVAEDHASKQPKSPGSWRATPVAKRELCEKLSQPFQSPNAGLLQAFFLRARSTQRRGARPAEFISLSGQCAARSALISDMRIKRISGGAAATEHLRAPMNSPTGGNCAQRVSFSKHQR
jgi:hypothetical protein